MSESPALTMAPHDELGRLQLLNAIFQTLNRSVHLQEALDTALAQTVRLLGLETGWIFLFHEETNRFTLAATEHLPPALEAEDWGEGCDCQGYFRKGKLTCAVNEVRCSRLVEAREAAQATGGLVVHASVPLRSGTRRLGILNVASRRWEEFSETDLALLQGIGEQMAITIERAQLHEQLKAQRISEQAALLRLSQALLTTDLNPEAIINQVAHITREVLHVDGAAVLLSERPEVESRGGQCVLAEEGLPWPCTEVEALESLGPGGSLVYALQRGFPISSPDLASERRFAVPPTLLENGFQAALRAPMIAEGKPLGLLGAYSRTPRQFTEQEHRLLSLFANQAAIAISKARFFRDSLARERLLQEIELARSIQSSLLPVSPPAFPGWQFAAYWQPATTVAGDFYDFLALRDGRLGVMIADVAGKGMAAALFMALSRSVARTMAFSRRRDSPAKSLIKANDLILADSRAELFVTLFYGILDPPSGLLRFANAGHPPPIQIHADGAISILWQPMPRQPLGIFPGISLADQMATIAPGEALLLYTDGATDLFGDSVVEGQIELAQAFAALAGLPAEQLVGELVRVLRAAGNRSGSPDDMALMVLKRDPLPAEEQPDASG